MDKATAQNDRSVEEYTASLDEQTAKDSQVLVEMMRRIKRTRTKAVECRHNRV